MSDWKAESKFLQDKAGLMGHTLVMNPSGLAIVITSVDIQTSTGTVRLFPTLDDAKAFLRRPQ